MVTRGGCRFRSGPAERDARRGEAERPCDVAAASEHGGGREPAHERVGPDDGVGVRATARAIAHGLRPRGSGASAKPVELYPASGNELRFVPVATDELDLGALSSQRGATASAGTTCPAVPPAPIKISGAFIRRAGDESPSSCTARNSLAAGREIPRSSPIATSMTTGSLARRR